MDGKAMRATRRSAHPVQLLGVLDHATGVVLAQVDIDEKTNEIPLFSTALDQIPDTTDVVITVDALSRRLIRGRHQASATAGDGADLPVSASVADGLSVGVRNGRPAAT